MEKYKKIKRTEDKHDRYQLKKMLSVESSTSCDSPGSRTPKSDDELLKCYWRYGIQFTNDPVILMQHIFETLIDLNYVSHLLKFKLSLKELFPLGMENEYSCL